MMSTAFPGHGSNMVTSKKTNRDTGSFDMFKIPCPFLVEKYNAYMGVEVLVLHLPPIEGMGKNPVEKKVCGRPCGYVNK